MRGHLVSGDLHLDLGQRRVTLDGSEVGVGKLTYRLLRTLTTAAPSLVTKNDLIESVWNGRAVSPETVAQRVKILRMALHDNAKSPSYVEVVHGQGYRWIPKVIRSDRTPEAEFVGNPAASDGVNIVIPEKPSVAVLPFAVLAGASDEQLRFAEALSHDVITGVGRARSMFVVDRGTSFMFRGNGHAADDIAARLGVRYVVQGSVDFSGDRIRVYASLVDAQSNEEIWSECFPGRVDDVLEINEQIAGQSASGRPRLLQPIAARTA